MDNTTAHEAAAAAAGAAAAELQVAEGKEKEDVMEVPGLREDSGQIHVSSVNWEPTNCSKVCTKTWMEKLSV